jgi:hypothetical protein
MAVLPIAAFLRFIAGVSIEVLLSELSEDTFERAISETPVELRMVELLFSRTGDDPSDRSMVTLHLMNVTGGDPDSSWTSGDYATVEGIIDARWTSLKTKYGADVQFRGYRWYRAGAGVPAINPVVRVTARNVAGTAAADSLPPQDACTVTWVTPIRREWGRIYLPSLSRLSLAGNGRWNTGDVDWIAAWANGLYGDLAAEDFYIVVWSRVHQAIIGVSEIRVDDVPDIQRRRRFRSAVYRKTYDADS